MTNRSYYLFFDHCFSPHWIFISHTRVSHRLFVSFVSLLFYRVALGFCFLFNHFRNHLNFFWLQMIDHRHHLFVRFQLLLMISFLRPLINQRVNEHRRKFRFVIRNRIVSIRTTFFEVFMFTLIRILHSIHRTTVYH